MISSIRVLVCLYLRVFVSTCVRTRVFVSSCVRDFVCSCPRAFILVFPCFRVFVSSCVHVAHKRMRADCFLLLLSLAAGALHRMDCVPLLLPRAVDAD